MLLCNAELPTFNSAFVLWLNASGSCGCSPRCELSQFDISNDYKECQVRLFNNYLKVIQSAAEVVSY